MPRYGRVIQVTNVTPSATKGQMLELFSFLGPVESIKLVPDPDLGDTSVVSRACFVLFEEVESCSLALHLTNTVFIDKAIIVVPVATEALPSDDVALQLTTPATPSAGKAAPETTKVNEALRTVCIGNLNKGLTSDQVKGIFEQCGEVKNVQLSMDESQPTKFGFVEFFDEASVEKAVKLTGLQVGEYAMKVDYSNAVVGQAQSATARVVQAALEKVAKAQEKIDGKDPTGGVSSGGVPRGGRNWRRRRSSSRSRSRSPGGRFRNRYYVRRSRRSSSRSPPKRHRSKSRSKSRDRDRDRKLDRKRRHRSPSRSPRRGRRRSRSRSGDESRERKRRRPSSSPESSRNRDRKKHKKRRSRERSRDRKEKRKKGRDRSAEPHSGAEGKSKAKGAEKGRERSDDDEATKTSDAGAPDRE